MANSKVQLANGTVLMDLTDTTASAGDVVSGKAFYGANGSKVTGTLTIQHYYTGTTEPSASLGVDGDIYLRTN